MLRSNPRRRSQRKVEGLNFRDIPSHNTIEACTTLHCAVVYDQGRDEKTTSIARSEELRTRYFAIRGRLRNAGCLPRAMRLSCPPGYENEQGEAKMNSKGINWVRKLKLVLFAAILGWYVGGSESALADAHCFCKLSCYNQAGNLSVGSTLKDYGWLATYTGINQQGGANQNACAGLCASAASADIHSQALATAACAMGCPNGDVVKAYSAVGNKPYRDDNLTIGTLVHTPPVTKTTYDCNAMPGTWLDNPSSGNGNHARCIKNSCDAVAGVPPAPSWTSIGTAWSTATGAAWVTDGSGNIWYGIPAHATTTVVSPAECHF
jgi:hypothetical protein